MKTLQSPSLNGRAQKTLAHQLDRLDEILDGFADALQAAVGEAVAAAVGAAVRDAVAVAVREALAAQAQMHRQAQASPAPSPLPEAEVEYEVPVAAPSRWTRFRAKVAAVGRSICKTVAAVLAPRARTVAGRALRGTAVTVAAAKAGVALVRGDRRAGRWAALAGLLAALACGFGDPLVAALVGGTAVAVLTAATVMTAPIWRPVLNMMGEADNR